MVRACNVAQGANTRFSKEMFTTWKWSEQKYVWWEGKIDKCFKGDTDEYRQNDTYEHPKGDTDEYRKNDTYEHKKEDTDEYQRNDTYEHQKKIQTSIERMTQTSIKRRYRRV